MASQTRAKRYASSRMNGYSAPAMLIKYSQSKPNRHWQATCLTEILNWRGNGHYVESDATWEKKKNEMKFFLLDQIDQERVEDELNKCKNEKEKDEKALEMLGSLTKFMEKHPSKKLYLRCMPCPRFGSTEPPRFFAEDVLEVLPLALKKQKVPETEFSDYLKKLHEEFKNPQVPTLHQTINLKRLVQILVDLDVNKELILIVDDPFHNITRSDNHSCGRVFGFFGPNSDEVLDSSHSINFLFQNLVVGLDWTKEELKSGTMKKKIMGAMEGCRKSREEFFISKTHLLSLISPIKDEFSLGPSEGLLNTYMLNDRLGNVEYPTSQYVEIAKKFNLPIYTNPQPDAKKTVLPVWMTRFFLALGWTETFFTGPGTEVLKDSMMNNLLHLLPAPKCAADSERFQALVLRNQQSGKKIEIGVQNVNLSANDPPNSFDQALKAAFRKKRAAEKAAAPGGQ